MTKTLDEIFLPELGDATQGSVRDIYQKEKELFLIASDRISCFDQILGEQIPHKGRILTEIAAFWFEKTKDIISNHLVAHPDPNVLVAKKCKTIAVEVIVRQYITGSMWRAYERGERSFCGVQLPEGLTYNQRLPEAIITPTTKTHHGHDENISAQEIIEQGLCSPDVWSAITHTALKLFKRGQEVAAERGLILVDTKYEFGLDENGELILIDEIHTPDSSRYWTQSPKASQQLNWSDKELVRQWLQERHFTGEGTPPPLSEDIIQQASQRYISVYEQLTGQTFRAELSDPKERILDSLRETHFIKGCFALILCGSEKDYPFVSKIVEGLDKADIPSRTIACSAHKDPRRCMDIVDRYNASIEPLVCISVAGRSNALSGVMAANLRWPVIACPPFKDHADYLTNIHSSLQMPSNTPAMTVIDPGNAALAAARILKMREG